MLFEGVLGQTAVTGALQDTNQNEILPQIPHVRGEKKRLIDALSGPLLLKFISLFALSSSLFLN